MKNNPLWTFSVSVYADAKVEGACLALQDDYGANINVLLLLLWLGQGGKRISDSELKDLLTAIEPWHKACVTVLRRLRRQLKTDQYQGFEGAEALRTQIAAAELDAERIEQDCIYREISDGLEGWSAQFRGDACAVAIANLRGYWRELGRDFPGGAAQPIEVLLMAVFGSAPQIKA